MRELPVLFSTPIVRAVTRGRNPAEWPGFARDRRSALVGPAQDSLPSGGVVLGHAPGFRLRLLRRSCARYERCSPLGALEVVLEAQFVVDGPSANPRPVKPRSGRRFDQRPMRTNLERFSHREVPDFIPDFIPEPIVRDGAEVCN